MYQLKGFSRLAIGFDVHKNHIESPYSRSVFNFLPGLDSSVGLCAVTCLATLNISILQSISRSNWNVGFWIFNGGVHLESFSRTQNFPQCPMSSTAIQSRIFVNSPRGS